MGWLVIGLSVGYFGLLDILRLGLCCHLAICVCLILMICLRLIWVWFGVFVWLFTVGGCGVFVFDVVGECGVSVWLVFWVLICVVELFGLCCIGVGFCFWVFLCIYLGMMIMFGTLDLWLLILCCVCVLWVDVCFVDLFMFWVT